jgi:hypothetical protein
MNSMRSLVRSVISEVEPSREVFGDETMQTFFSQVKVLVSCAFGALETEVQSVTGKSDEWKKRAMDRGLTFMADEANEDTIIDSVAETDDVCRSLSTLYYSAMNSFVRDRVSKRQLMSMDYEPFGVFIAKLYRYLAGDKAMKHEYFKSMSYSDKDTFLADMLRRVMENAVRWPADAKPTPKSVFSTPLTPNDSVSNISKLKPPQVKSVATSRVMEDASRVGNSVAKVVTAAATDGLSSDSLREHNSRSRFSAFKQPSVVALKPKVIAVSMDTSRTGKTQSVAASRVSNA